MGPGGGEVPARRRGNLIVGIQCYVNEWNVTSVYKQGLLRMEDYVIQQVSMEPKII